MYRFIESICIQDGKIKHLQLHNERLNRTRKICLNSKKALNLFDVLQVPKAYQKGRVKCRVLYADTIEKIEFQSYQIKPIRSLKLVHHNDIDYTFKSENRNTLTQLFQKRGNYDDIIICRNGRITDSYYANLVFDDGQMLYTSHQPLLKGIKREYLLHNNQIQSIDIQQLDLKYFHQVYLINAMLDLGECVVPLNNCRL